MDNERAKEIKMFKVAHDVSTLVRVLPWIFMMQDQRGPAALTKMAFDETKGFLESDNSDPTRDRKAFMRGLMMNWFNAMGIRVDPNAIEMITGLIAQQVDGYIDPMYDDGIEAEKA